jgi:predicted CopG family antitoxin
MGHALRKIKPESRSFSERIRELVEADKVASARRLLAEALERGEKETDLSEWQKVLAPGRVLGTNSELGPELTPEFQWLDANSRSYRRQWVALADNRLLAHSEDVDEVLAAIKDMKLGRRPLLHYIG